MHTADYCIVIAEDDEVLRYCTVKLLERHGYKIIEAADGQEALDLLEQCNDPVHLLITNYDMPRVNGVELARRMRQKHDKLTVLLISGLAPDLDPNDNIEVLQKPYNQATLATKVRNLLLSAGNA